MGNIPANFGVDTQGVNYQDQVNPNYGMQGYELAEDANRINAQTGQMMADALGGVAQTGMNIYMKHREGQNRADTAHAKSVVEDYKLRMQQEIIKTNNPEKVQQITEKYGEDIRKALNGKNPDGIPYFRNSSALKNFQEMYLKNEISDWQRKGSQTAFELDLRNSRARISLSVDDYIKNPDAPNSKSNISETLDQLAVLGVPAEEIKLRKQEAFRKLNLNQVNQLRANLEFEVDRLASIGGNITPELQSKINESKKIASKLDNLSDLEKEKIFNEFDSYSTQAERLNNEKRAEYLQYVKDQTKSNDLKISYMFKDGASLKDINKFLNDNVGFVSKSEVDRYANMINEERKKQLDLSLKERENKIDVIQKENQKRVDKFNDSLVISSLHSYRPEDDEGNQVRLALSGQIALMKERNSPYYEEAKKIFEEADKNISLLHKDYIDNAKTAFTKLLKIEPIKDVVKEKEVFRDYEGVKRFERQQLFSDIMYRYKDLIGDNKFNEAEQYYNKKFNEIDASIKADTFKEKYFIKSPLKEKTKQEVKQGPIKYRFLDKNTGKIYTLDENNNKVYE